MMLFNIFTVTHAHENGFTQKAPYPFANAFFRRGCIKQPLFVY